MLEESVKYKKCGRQARGEEGMLEKVHGRLRRAAPVAVTGRRSRFLI
jgi:hypothetical protein